MKDYGVAECWETLTNLGVSEQTLQFATSLTGHTTETMEAVLYIQTGLGTFDQLNEELF